VVARAMGGSVNLPFGDMAREAEVGAGNFEQLRAFAGTFGLGKRCYIRLSYGTN
jgi:hypothetical protein